MYSARRPNSRGSFSTKSLSHKYKNEKNIFEKKNTKIKKACPKNLYYYNFTTDNGYSLLYHSCVFIIHSVTALPKDIIIIG